MLIELVYSFVLDLLQAQPRKLVPGTDSVALDEALKEQFPKELY